MRSLTLMAIICASCTLSGCSRPVEKMPLETDDYRMETGCGCNYSAQAQVVTTLKKSNALGRHEIIRLTAEQEQPSVSATPFVHIVDYGNLHRAFIAWKCGDETLYSELSSEKIKVVIDDGAAHPDIQWKWDTRSLRESGKPLKEIADLAGNYIDLATLRINQKDLKNEHRSIKAKAK